MQHPISSSLHRALRTRHWFSALSVLSFVALGAVVACDTSTDDSEEIQEEQKGFRCATDSECAEGLYCGSDGACTRECATCGVLCSGDDQCPTGQICSDGGECQQECDPIGNNDLQCGEGVCTAAGTCTAVDNLDVLPTDPTTAVGGSPGDDVECIEVEVSFDPVIPNVVLVIDQSASMTDDSDFKVAVDAAETAGTYTRWDCPDSENGNSAETGWDSDEEVDYAWRWNVVRNVLLNPENGVVKPLEEAVRFGLALYSSAGGDEGGTCPMLTEVDLAFGSHADMLTAFSCSTLIRDTPTRESLTAAAEKLAALDVEGPKVIVLATDGVPDSCACSDWNTAAGAACDANDSDNDVEVDGQTYDTEEYEQLLVALEAKRIHDELGISVEVINVGSTILKSHLDLVAANGGAISGASIEGTSPGTLIEAFQTIIDGVRSCVIELDGEITEGKEDTGTVLLDIDPTGEVAFEEITLNDPDGWRVNSPTEIELVGAACEDIKSGDHEIDVSFPCDAFIPIITK